MLEDIKQRLAVMPKYEDMNPYQLWFDAEYLLSELEYWRDRAIKTEDKLDKLNYSLWHQEVK